MQSNACGNATNPCNNGTCVGLNQCQCNAGFTGLFCNIVSCTNRGNCNGHGTCIYFYFYIYFFIDNSFFFIKGTGPDTCTCFAGWSGLACNIPDCSSITNCISGTCVAPNNCTCRSGYTGASCNVFVCELGCGSFGSCSGK